MAGREASVPAWMAGQRPPSQGQALPGPPPTGGAPRGPPGLASPAAMHQAGAPGPNPSPYGRPALHQPMGGAPGAMPQPHSSGAPPSSFPGAQRPLTSNPAMHAHPTAAAAAGARPAPGGEAAKPAVRCDWTQHTAPDGRFYYYNAKTKESRWQKPKELEAAQAAAAAAAEEAKRRAAAAAQDPVAACPWKEFKAPDGRKYYHNRATKQSVWTEPPELAEARAAAAAARKADASAAPAPAAAAQPAVRQPAPAASAAPAAAAAQAAATTPAAAAGASADPNGKFMYATKEDAKAAFKELLTAQRVSLDAKWDKIVKHLAACGDRRFSALKSNGERQSCFKEWVLEEREAAKVAERERERRAEASFIELLDSKQSMLQPGARFSKCEALCFEDPRWEVLPADRREAVFKQWMESRRVEQERKARAEVEAKMQQFQELLEGTSGVKASTQWAKIEQQLDGEPAFQALPAVQRLEVWERMLRTLAQEEEEERTKKDAARFRQERKNRDAFKQLLSKHREKAIINAKTRWKRYRELIRKESEYLAVEANISGSRPKELFLDCLEDMEERFDRDKLRMKDALSKAGFVVTQETEWTDMLSQLEKCEEGDVRLQDVLDVNKRLYFEELWGRSREREAKEAKRRKSARHDLEKALKRASSRHVRPDMLWAEARPALERIAPVVKHMDAEEAERVFEEWAARQREKARARDKGEKRERREREHKRRSRGDDGEGPDAKRPRHSVEPSSADRGSPSVEPAATDAGRGGKHTVSGASQRSPTERAPSPTSRRSHKSSGDGAGSADVEEGEV